MARITSWYGLLDEAMARTKETREHIVHTTADEVILNHPIEDDYGVFDHLEIENPKLVTWNAWTQDHVYYPAEYDGRCEVGYAPRNPPSPELDVNHARYGGQF